MELMLSTSRRDASFCIQDMRKIGVERLLDNLVDLTLPPCIGGFGSLSRAFAHSLLLLLEIATERPQHVAFDHVPRLLLRDLGVNHE